MAIAVAAALAALPAAAQARAGAVRIVVVERAPGSPAAERLVTRAGGRIGRRLALAHGFQAMVPTRALPALRRARAVAGVWPDASVRMRSDAGSCSPVDPVCFDALAPDSAWEQAIGLPNVPRRDNGAGVTVASIDTGVVPNPDLGHRLLARVDLTSEGDGIDRFGHGTHMAGLIAGDGTTSRGPSRARRARRTSSR